MADFITDVWLTETSKAPTLRFRGINRSAYKMASRTLLSPPQSLGSSPRTSSTSPSLPPSHLLLGTQELLIPYSLKTPTRLSSTPKLNHLHTTKTSLWATLTTQAGIRKPSHFSLCLAQNGTKTSLCPSFRAWICRKRQLQLPRLPQLKSNKRIDGLTLQSIILTTAHIRFICMDTASMFYRSIVRIALVAGAVSIRSQARLRLRGKTWNTLCGRTRFPYRAADM